MFCFVALFFYPALKRPARLLCLNKSLLNSKLRDDCFLRPPKQKINDAVHGV